MQAGKTIKESFAEARQMEQAGKLEQAAAVYQKLLDGDLDNQPAVARLLVIYRKLKEYRKELAVIDTVLAAYAQRDKDLQAKWIKDHPKAAGTSRSMVKQLGGFRVSAFGVNPVVSGLRRRKEIIVERLGGRKGKAAKQEKPVRGSASAAGKKAAEDKRDVASAERREAVARRREEAEQRKQKARAVREAAAQARRAAAAERKQAAAEAKAAKQPSLFVITLRYQVSLDKIDAAMPSHMAFLKKHFEKRDFLVSGRQVPRTGGIIIARGKDRDSMERLMKSDPFVKGKLAGVDIVEFKTSQVGKGKTTRGTLF
jgi:uncharacterized protein YciI